MCHDTYRRCVPTACVRACPVRLLPSFSFLLFLLFECLAHDKPSLVGTYLTLQVTTGRGGDDVVVVCDVSRHVPHAAGRE